LIDAGGEIPSCLHQQQIHDIYYKKVKGFRISADKDSKENMVW